ncbi:hypothetical protein [Legionella sp.]|uniref:hypothetical protein n=1 Tax=Legionella sp. TaxID=459 RepID=UPI003C821D59
MTTLDEQTLSMILQMVQKPTSQYDIEGKTYVDLYDKNSAIFYKKSDKSVMEQGISLSLKEPLYQSDGIKLTYLSKKVPLYD